MDIDWKKEINEELMRLKREGKDIGNPTFFVGTKLYENLLAFLVSSQSDCIDRKKVKEVLSDPNVCRLNLNRSIKIKDDFLMVAEGEDIPKEKLLPEIPENCESLW